jgi:hypothetical protein
MPGLVFLRTFNSRNEAEAVQTVLSGSGSESRVESDDLGALDSALAKDWANNILYAGAASGGVWNKSAISCLIRTSFGVRRSS